MAAGGAEGIWLLPEGVSDELPHQAKRLEHLRRRLLDQLALSGYELVYTPFIEFTDSLLAGSAIADLDRMTFKLVDPVSGRLMGVRADMTPQVARMDANRANAAPVSRYCYAATVLHAYPQGTRLSRTPLQVGAELYGSTDLEADLEIIGLMLQTLAAAGIALGSLHLDIGHVGIFRLLARLAGLTDDQEALLFDVYQRKSLPELDELAQRYPDGDTFRQLGRFTGDLRVLRAQLAVQIDQLPALGDAIDRLMLTAERIKARFPDVSLGVDVSELRGYHYHTGLVFAVYAAGSAVPIAQGGRYDEIGLAFGRARAATGFSCDLYTLAQVGQVAVPALTRIAAPDASGVTRAQAQRLEQVIAQLRMQGQSVVRVLAEDDVAAPLWTHELVFQSGDWQVMPVVTSEAS